MEEGRNVTALVDVESGFVCDACGEPTIICVRRLNEPQDWELAIPQQVVGLACSIIGETKYLRFDVCAICTHLSWWDLRKKLIEVHAARIEGAP